MANAPKVTESKFKAIKILIESGATYAEIKEMMDVGNNVVSCIKYSENYEEYKHKMYVMYSGSAHRNKQKEQAKAVAAKVGAVPASQLAQPNVTESKQTIIMQVSNYMLDEQRKTNELLTLISSKLAYIIDQLT